MTYLGAYTSLKAVGYFVILAMAGSIAFAAYIALTHYNGIGV